MVPNFLKYVQSRPLLFSFSLIDTVDSKYNLPMTGFEPRISGVGTDRSTN